MALLHTMGSSSKTEHHVGLLQNTKNNYLHIAISRKRNHKLIFKILVTKYTTKNNLDAVAIVARGIKNTNGVIQGGSLFILYLPIYSKGKLHSLLAAVQQEKIRINAIHVNCNWVQKIPKKQD